MSILKVDTINEKTSGNGVQIAGHVIQFVHYTGTTSAAISGNNTYVNGAPDGTHTITPKFSNSIIVYRFYAGGLVQNSNDLGLRLKRDSTVVFANDRHGFCNLPSNWAPINWSFQAIDTPNTTSQLTYTMEVKATQGYARINDYNGVANRYYVTIEEIAQ